MSGDVIEAMAKAMDAHRVAARKGPLRRALTGVGCTCGWESSAEIEFHSHLAAVALAVVLDHLTGPEFEAHIFVARRKIPQDALPDFAAAVRNYLEGDTP